MKELNNRPKLVLVGGGTGGHVTPLIALAQEFRDRQPQVQLYYLGAKADVIGKNLVTQADCFDRQTFLRAGKWHRLGKVRRLDFIKIYQKQFWLNLRYFGLFMIGIIQSWRYFKQYQPDLVFSKGGYTAMAPCLVARFLKIPLVVHDSDAVLGLVHQYVQRQARLCLTGFDTKSQNPKVKHVGIPVEASFTEPLTSADIKEINKRYQLTGSKQWILITGGGRGSQRLNQAFIAVLGKLRLKPETRFVLLTGKASYQETVEALNKTKFKDLVRVYDFVYDMSLLVRYCSGVVTRAGASSLVEVSLAGKPLVIVPNPLLARRHQIHNALIYQRAQAAWLVSDDGVEVNQTALKNALNQLINNEIKRSQIQKRAQNLVIKDATTKTFEAVQSTLEEIVTPTQGLQTNTKSLLIKRFNEAQTRQKRRRRFWGYLVIGGLILMAGLGIAQFFYTNKVKLKLAVNSPIVTQNQLQALEVKASQVLDQSSLFNKYFNPGSDLVALLQDQTYLESFNFTRNWWHSQLIVELTPKSILGSFTAPGCETLIAEDGGAILADPSLVEFNDLILKIQTDLRFDCRQAQILDELEVDFLTQISVYLSGRGYKLSQIIISSNPREMILKVNDYEYQILTLTTVDPIKQGIAISQFLDRLQAILETGNPEENAIPKEYIDVRGLQRVYYK